MLVISVRKSFLELIGIESDLTAAMYDKTWIAFITYIVIRSLIGIPIKCVVQITESFKTAFDFLLVFFILSLMKWFKSINLN